MPFRIRSDAFYEKQVDTNIRNYYGFEIVFPRKYFALMVAFCAKKPEIVAKATEYGKSRAAVNIWKSLPARDEFQTDGEPQGYLVVITIIFLILSPSLYFADSFALFNETVISLISSGFIFFNCFSVIGLPSSI